MIDTSKTSTCLNKKIALSSCEAINIEGSCSVRDVLTGGYIRSNDKDPEILINIVFQENVNLNGLTIEAANKEKRPELLMIFINNPNLNIGDIESLKPTETIVLNESNIGKKISLKIAKFRNVSSLNVRISFIKDVLD
jgi:hypothetical protein